MYATVRWVLLFAAMLWQPALADAGDAPDRRTGNDQAMTRPERAPRDRTMVVRTRTSSDPGVLIRPGAAAVVGCVRYPACYALETGVTLKSLIDRAGGLTAGSASRVRIERPGQSILAAIDRGDQTIQPGDVVVVIGDTAAGAQVPRNASETACVVLVGLIDRPVVVQADPVHPTLSGLLRSLELPAELLDSAQSRPPAGPLRRGETNLVAGMVVALDGSHVDSASLANNPHWSVPTPAAIEMPDQDLEAGLAFRTDESAVEDAAAGQIPQPAPDLPDDDEPPAELMAAEPVHNNLADSRPGPGDEPAVVELNSPERSAPAFEDDIPMPPPEPARAVGTSGAAQPGAAGQFHGGRANSARLAIKSDFARVDLQASDAREAMPSGRQPMLDAFWLGIGAVGILVLVVWLLSHARLRRRAWDTAVPRAHIMDDVIDEEPVEIASQVDLQGRVVGLARMIVHPPQSLEAPHFLSETPRSAPAASDSSIVPSGSFGGLHSRPSSPGGDGGLLERVLLAMQREVRR